MALDAVVSWPTAPFTESLVRNALHTLSLPLDIASAPPDPIHDRGLLQWSTYDLIDHDLTHLHRDRVLSSSYIYRKALIRKHFLSRCIHSYTTKNPSSSLKDGSPRTYEIELSFADELDEMWTDELWELGNELANPQLWWILKPGMADRGMGIRLFNSKAALQKIFEEFEDADSEDEEESDTRIATSQLRHFVIQEYIPNPLLLDPSESTNIGPLEFKVLHGHKFHLRAYCVASGALQIYLYHRILALFSAVPYTKPVAQDDFPMSLEPHLTNTSLQSHHGENGVRLLEELIGCHILSGFDAEPQPELKTNDVTKILDQMVDILADTFKAALQNPVHFQPLPNAFELYGIDFLVSHTPASSQQEPSFSVKLLEINAEPAIELTGPRLSWILEDLFVATGKVCVEPFFAGPDPSKATATDSWHIKETRYGLIKCLDEAVRG